MKHNYLYLLLLFLLSGCISFGNEDEYPNEVDGFKPVYASKEKINSISTLEARVLQKPGKIYTYGKYLFIGESGKGVHIIDNADTKQPKALSFIEIPFNNDIAIKGSIMYADNYGDLVVFDISNPTDVKLMNRITNALPQNSSQLPPEQGFFECVDASKGAVVGWERVKIKSPKCRY
jgi:LVIVD repeat